MPRLIAVAWMLLLLLLAGRGLAAGEGNAPQPAEPKPLPFAKEIQAFVAADAKQPPAPGQVLFVGSSSIRLWDLKKSFPELAALNRGFGGSKIEDSVRYFDQIVLPYKPRLIVFYAGDNDTAGAKTAEQVRDDFRAFTAKCKAAFPATKVIFIAIKPSPSRWNKYDKQSQANALIAEDCKADPERLIYLDVVTPMLGADGQPRAELFQKDLLHLNAEGYKLWAGLLEPLLKSGA